jgi:hypothetical protein
MKTAENYLEFNYSDDSVVICQEGITYVIGFDYPTIGGFSGNIPQISKVIECWDQNDNILSTNISEEKLQELQVLINKNYSHEANV